MNQRKTMKLWQMIVLVILLVALLVTVFLPAYHINGNAFVKMYKVIMHQVESNSELSELTELFDNVDEKDLNEQKVELDEKVRDTEEEYGIKISSITPGSFMIHSFETFWGNSYEEMEFLKELKSGWTAIRVILWIIYILALVMILIIVFGFCFKWTKYIALAISSVYGVIVAIAFGIFQFLSPGMLADSINHSIDLAGWFGIAGIGLDHTMQSELSTLMTKMISCFWGIAFLIGFIIAVLFVITSVVSMFIGGYSTGVSGGDNGDWQEFPPNDDSIGFYDDQERRERERRERERQERERQERDRQERLERERQEQERLERERQKQIATPPMGLVRCTKGVAAGQGFSLPEDRKVVVGKSNQNANMIISYPHVSNIHCSIRYKAATNSYIVKDHSSNGTFVNGVRLQKDVPMEFPAGTVLQLADGSNEITLG